MKAKEEKPTRLLTAKQRTHLAEQLAAGLTMPEAAQAIRRTEASVQQTIESDDEFAANVELAMGIGAAKRVPPPPPVPLPPPTLPPAPPRQEAAPTHRVEPPAPPEASIELAGRLVDVSERWIERWANVREQAKRLGEGRCGQLRWVEERCVQAGMHPMDRQWAWHFEEFYKSGKFVDVGRFGLRAAKSDSNCRAIVAEVLLTPRVLEPGLVGVCPVIAQNMREANDRCTTIVAILNACGFSEQTSRTRDLYGYQRAGGGTVAMVISLHDGEGHPVEFRIYPANISGAVGFTGIAGFCDEVDLWGNDKQANPASRVIELLITRYTTQKNALLHVMSASYMGDSEHAKMIARGDTALQRVARLGEDGAKIDTEARARLASIIHSTDALLTTPAKADSTDIPCWVSNPVAPIETCFALAGGDIKRMIFLYGGRVNPSVGRAQSMNIEELQALGEANLKLVGGRETPRLQTFDGLPSWDPRSRNFQGGGGGGQSL